MTRVCGCDWLSQRRVSIPSVWQRRRRWRSHAPINLMCGPQLTARRVDRGSPVLADCGVHTQGGEAVAEVAHARRRCAPHRIPGCGVEGDEVDVGAEGTGEGGQLACVDGPV